MELLRGRVAALSGERMGSGVQVAKGRHNCFERDVQRGLSEETSVVRLCKERERKVSMYVLGGGSR